MEWRFLHNNFVKTYTAKSSNKKNQTLNTKWNSSDQVSSCQQEDERKRIARDLHDELGAVLSILRMHLIQLETQIEPSLHDKTKNMRELTEASDE